MGIVQSIKSGFTKKTIEELRAELARAEARRAEASTAWADNESEVRWRAVEDATRERDQIRERLARAEQREADERAREERERVARVEAEIRERSARIASVDRYRAETAKAIVAIHAQLVAVAASLHEQIATREADIARVQELAAQLGREVKFESVSVATIVNDCKLAVATDRGTRRTDGIIADIALELVAGHGWIFRGDRR